MSDNGIGFPERVDYLHSPSLGLTLVKSLVEQINGTIEEEVPPFTITFG